MAPAAAQPLDNSIATGCSLDHGHLCGLSWQHGCWTSTQAIDGRFMDQDMVLVSSPDQTSPYFGDKQAGATPISRFPAAFNSFSSASSHNELVILPLFLSHFYTIYFLIIMAARPVAVFSHRLSGLRLAHGGPWEFHLCCQKLLLVFSFFAVCILLLV